ncbi:MAG: hypothetical protein V1916_01375 [Patescibacteria group bacterium]
MKLSQLQKYILRASAGTAAKTKRSVLLRYYDRQAKATQKEDQQGILTRSVERLIDKGLAIGYGRRTQEKWFIDEVRLTDLGRREARKLRGQQQTLPMAFRTTKRIKKK